MYLLFLEGWGGRRVNKGAVFKVTSSEDFHAETRLRKEGVGRLMTAVDLRLDQFTYFKSWRLIILSLRDVIGLM